MPGTGFWMGDSGGFGYPDQRIASGPPPGTDPFKLGGRVPARWTFPYSGYNQPILELPQNRSMRITLATNAFLGDPIINSAAKLTIFMAFENMLLTVTSKCKKIPDWIPESELPRYKAVYGSNTAMLVAAYVKQKCLELSVDMGIKNFFENEALDIAIAGDAYVNIASNTLPQDEQQVWHARTPEERRQKVEEIKKKLTQGGDGPPDLPYNIFALQSLNPSAVWLYPDYAGRLTHAKVVHLLGEGVWDLNMDNLIHLKGFSWNWTVYGIPHYISALKWVDIKFKMMDALYTNAMRYVSPREWLEIKGPEDQNKAALPPTPQQMAWAEQLLSNYAMNAPFAMPAGWEWKYLGAEGKVLRVEMLLEKIDDAIRTAAQVSRTFTSGAANVPAYATSKLQAGVMYKAIAPLADWVARAIEGRILKRFCLMNGFFEEDGTLIAPKVTFESKPIQGDDSVENKIDTLGRLGWLSPITAWEMEGIDPVLEMERIENARLGLTEPFRSLAPDLGPDQTPERFDEIREQLQEQSDKFDQYMGELAHARNMGHQKIMRTIKDIMQGGRNAERLAYQMGRYMAQAALLQRSDAENRLDHADDWDEQIRRTKEQTELMHDEDAIHEAATVTATIRNNDVSGRNGGYITS